MGPVYNLPSNNDGSRKPHEHCFHPQSIEARPTSSWFQHEQLPLSGETTKIECQRCCIFIAESLWITKCPKSTNIFSTVCRLFKVQSTKATLCSEQLTLGADQQNGNDARLRSRSQPTNQIVIFTFSDKNS